MSYKYMVRLKPIGCYYFGGETTLGEGTAQNYYVKSNLLPQVSALVGIIRYEILRQNRLLSYDINQKDTLAQVKRLIGSRGFCMGDSSKTFGIIQRLSPLFIENQAEGEFYTPLPLDYGLEIQLRSEVNCSFSAYANNAKVADIIGYNAKDYDNYTYWISGNGNKLRTDELFYTKEQVGITKNGRAENDKDAFFKMILIGLNDAYNFAFILETSEPVAEVRQGVCALGGNRSMFQMNLTALDVHKEPSDFCDYFQSLKKKGRLLLLGDAYLTDKQRDALPFFWANSICNRYIVTLHDQGHNWRKPLKTQKLYHLLARGGVLCCAPEDVPRPDCLCNVGLNIFI